MQINRKHNLGVIEGKVYNALVELANDKMIAKASNKEIAKAIGYKTWGGGLTFALKILHMKRIINLQSKGVYKILL